MQSGFAGKRKLSNKECESAKAAEKLFSLGDGFGLFLDVFPNGSKRWRYVYRWQGRQKKLSLGMFPQVKLAEARQLHEEARVALQAGDDPSQLQISAVQKKKQALRESKEADQLLQRKQEQVELARQGRFDTVALEWLEKQSPRLSTGQYRRTLNSLKADIFPEIGHHRIDQISMRMLVKALQRIEDRGSLDMLRRVRGRCEKIFAYAQALELCDHNPALNLKHTQVFTPHVGDHHRFLRLEALGPFLRALDNYGGKRGRLTRLGLKLLILFVCRSKELFEARWGDFDLDRREWLIPAEQMKMRRDHLVPLSSQALELLRELRQLSGPTGLLLPNEQPGKRGISNMTFNRAIKRMGWLDRMVPHGFRSTFSTAANESGLWSSDAIERQLAHVQKNKVRAAYNRAEYIQERRELIQWWADQLDLVQQKN